MTDLEQRLRGILEDEARRAPAPHEPRDGVRRARRRQILTVVTSIASIVAVVAIAGFGISALVRSDGSLPADESTVTRSMNGVTITFPEGWSLIDPDAAGLNGGPTPSRDLPHLVVALAPTTDPLALGCPGRVADASFLFTVQETPTALNGAAARPWPVDLEPLFSAGGESGCYSGWEFLHAGWTAEGRTFEGRIGFAPASSDGERDVVRAAFASMTFEPGTSQALEWIVDQGTIGGQDWRIVASNDATDTASGPQLAIETDAGGSGIGYGPGPIDGPTFTQLEVGSGTDARVIVAGVVPGEVVELLVGGDVTPEAISVFDLPDRIDDRNRAFEIILPPDVRVVVTGFDADGNEITTFTVPSSTDGPTGTPVQVEGDLEDGRHFGFIRAVDAGAGTIRFDLASWLSGEEADAAYHAGGGTGPVPNDHFVVNDNPRLRTLALSPDLRLRLLDWDHCCDTFVDPGLPLFARAIETQSDVIDAGVRIRGQSQWWVTVEGGVVTEIEEQYSP